VVTVKPEWLCSTFGFHPMLGFRRRKQAESIAHGCAMTLATLYSLGAFGVDQETYRIWLDEWGAAKLFGLGAEAIEETSVKLDEEDLSVEERQDPRKIRDRGKIRVRLFPAEERTTADGEKQPRKDGECWFRKGAICPFHLGRDHAGDFPRRPDDRRQGPADRRRARAWWGAGERRKGPADRRQEVLRSELGRIHELCGRIATHRSKVDSMAES
jgi:hypothetical protein